MCSMASVSFRIPDEVKERMEEHDEVNWSEVLRRHLTDELHDLELRNVAHAVATSERLSTAIDPDAVANTNTAAAIRTFRDTR